MVVVIIKEKAYSLKFGMGFIIKLCNHWNIKKVSGLAEKLSSLSSDDDGDLSIDVLESFIDMIKVSLLFSAPSEITEDELNSIPDVIFSDGNKGLIEKFAEALMQSLPNSDSKSGTEESSSKKKI